MHNLLKDLMAVFDEIAQYADSTFLRSSRKIFFKDVLYHNILKIIEGFGTIPASNDAAFDTNKKFTPQAMSQACQKIPASYIAKINHRLRTKYFLANSNSQKRSFSRNSNRPRILAIDGSRTSLSKRMGKSKNSLFPHTNTRSYRKGLLTVVYNINDKVPICHNHVTHGNERKAFLELKSNLRPSDILIFDRGYYSLELLRQLLEADYFVIF